MRFHTAIYNHIAIIALIFMFGCASGSNPRNNPSSSVNASNQNKSFADLESQGELLTLSDTNPVPAKNRTYLPWRQRRGPAYPDDFWRSWGRDGKEFTPILWDDTTALAKNPFSLISLGLAGAAGIALQGPNADDPIEDHYEKNGSQLNSFWDSVGDAGGNPGTHFALAGTMYFTSLAQEDTKTYEFSKTMLSALALNGIITTILKAAARTEAPNGNENVWPSGHTSSTFTLATVMWGEYGPLVGLPLFAFAGYVGYERIDARNHNFSDVISGALIGMAVGHAVSKNHQLRIADFTLNPYLHPQRGTLGLALTKRW